MDIMFWAYTYARGWISSFFVTGKCFKEATKIIQETKKKKKKLIATLALRIQSDYNLM